jgi:hypothetical protein
LAMPMRPKTAKSQKAVDSPKYERTHLYFGYGSNMWKDQMARRCPESALIGVGLVHGW